MLMQTAGHSLIPRRAGLYDYAQQNSAYEMESAQPVIQDVQPTMDEVQPVINNAYSQQGYMSSSRTICRRAQPTGGYYGGISAELLSARQQLLRSAVRATSRPRTAITPSRSVTSQFQNFAQPQQPDQFNTPDYINPASPNMPGVTPGKGGSSLNRPDHSDNPYPRRYIYRRFLAVP